MLIKGALAACLMQSNLKLLCQFCKTYQSEKLRHKINFIAIIILYKKKKIRKKKCLKTIGGSKTRTHDLWVWSQRPYPLGHGRT